MRSSKEEARAEDALRASLEERILVLDGGMGTMLRGGATPADSMTLAEPERVRSVHLAFLEAGADVIATNTFNANAISMAGWGLADAVGSINAAAARTARAAVEEVNRAEPDRRRFVAGAIGPTSRVLQAVQGAAFEASVDAFLEQALALAEAGVDCFLAETLTSVAAARAALTAFERCFQIRGEGIPVLLSFAATEPEGARKPRDRVLEILDGTGDAAVTALGFNCGSGSGRTMRGYMETLSAETRAPTICYPSAGLPDPSGRYRRTPRQVASQLEGLARDGLLNLAGGCCGTRPAHIRRIREALAPHPPRRARPGGP